MANPLTFYKYHGTGNDFVLFDNRNARIPADAHDWFAALCHRRFGIGADGVMLLESHAELDFLMRYYNADGRPSSMCGNGARCIVQFAKRMGVIDTAATFEGPTGQHYRGQIAGKEVRIGMGKFDAPSTLEGESACFIDTGSPHYVRLLAGDADALSALDVFAEGRAVRQQQRWDAGGTNANFFVRTADGVAMRTYERGVEDETWSCGTGAVATALTAWYLQRKSIDETAEIAIATPGGQLRVARDEQQMVWLVGPAVAVFSGKLEGSLAIF